MNAHLAMVIIGFASVLGAIGQLFFKLGTSPINIIKVGIGFGLYGISFIIYLIALRSLQLHIAYPIISLSYIFVMILSAIFLNEKITLLNMFGSLLLVFSVFLISR